VSFQYEGVRGAEHHRSSPEAASHAPHPGNALSAATFSCEGSGTLALAGVNGSGKSTCLRVLMGLALPTEGAVRINGAPLGGMDLDAWRKKVGFLPQRPYLPPRTNVGEALRWLAPEATDERALEVLERVGILDRLRRGGGDPMLVPIDALSVGERQRVALARVLARDAAVYVLDEPDANLDRSGIALVTAVLSELGRTRRVIVAAHTPDLLAAADAVIVLEGGRVVGPRDTG
jgi:ATP-binding cassette subfamily C protein CydCD